MHIGLFPAKFKWLSLSKNISRYSIKLRISTILMFFLTLSATLFAQSKGTVHGLVTTGEGEPLPRVNVYLKGTNIGAATNMEGYYKITDIPEGKYTIIADIVGRESKEKEIVVKQGVVAEINFNLSVDPINMPGIVVTATRGEEITEMMSSLPPEVVERNPAKVTGELLREVPGVDAVRRGPLGLDPVVRGLRETQVGTYVDGTRYFPAGPARMDSPLSHLDPSAIKDIEVVKGPYALTWGAGNLSAIRAETQNIPPRTPGLLHGRILSGFHSNLDAIEGVASLFGKSKFISYWAHANWREGNDYETGLGAKIPADFRSRELRGKLGIQLSPMSQITISGGFQDQDDIDYPGRLLNAEFFETLNLNARYILEQSKGILRSLEVMGYINDVDHGMNNNGKPTAQPDPTRIPPFPLSITIDSGINVKGGRIIAKLVPKNLWKFEVGGDIYSANRDASRQISRSDNQVTLFENDIVWPDATITDLGLFTKLIRPLSEKIQATGTVRLDLVNANADTSSEFFAENISTDFDASETNISASFMLEASVSNHWLIAAGAGSAVRTADASERYSDRFPASKAQTSAEFVGNPKLNPERSTQADLWIEGNYHHVTFYLNAFARRIDNYITLQATDLPKKLPLSPPTVFKYVNGEADFWGLEASTNLRLTRHLTTNLTGTYLWGEDNSLDEPVLGVAPLTGEAGVRYQGSNNQFFLEGLVHAVYEQDRIARKRGETETAGYATVDLRGGLQLVQGLEFRFGVLNLLDKEYINHLNAKNPFTGRQIPEPGRVFFSNLSFTF